MKSSNEKISKGIIVQSISVMILLILVILTMFNNVFLILADIVAGITFLIIAYNKKEISKKLMYICIIFGIVFILLGVYNFLG